MEASTMAKVNLWKIFWWTFILAYLCFIFTIVGFGYYNEHKMDGNNATDTPDNQTHKLNSNPMSVNITMEESILVPISSSSDRPLNVTGIPEGLQQPEIKTNGTTIKPLATEGESRNNQTLGSPHGYQTFPGYLPVQQQKLNQTL